MLIVCLDGEVDGCNNMLWSDHTAEKKESNNSCPRRTDVMSISFPLPSYL